MLLKTMNNSNIAENTPLVTVYIPTYNRVKLLKRAVESVLSQDYHNIELIVVDDRSTDTTVDYLHAIVKNDKRVKYFINEENSGACVSRNKAIFAAKGKFITGLDDDDYFLPNRISSFVNIWDNIPEDCIALYSNIFNKLDDNNIKKSKKKKQCSHLELICANWIGNQIFTETSSLQAIGGFDVEFPAWQDLDCWYRLLSIKKSKAYLLEVESYIVDTSHPHERITSGKISTISKAFDYFCKNHDLTSYQRDVMTLQLIPYNSNMPETKSIIRRIIYSPKPYNIRSSLSMLIRPRVKKLLNKFNRILDSKANSIF